MIDLTQRQIWNTLRNLVSDNNSSIKKVFSSATCARINARNEFYRWDSQTLNFTKSVAIRDGLKSVYKTIGDRFTENDFEAKDYYHCLLNEEKNWYDKLSNDDLFMLYIFQNKIISKFEKQDKWDIKDFIKSINEVKFGKYFSGKIDFSGKPQKVEEDKQPFDILDKNNINQVLITSTQSAYNKYLLQKGEKPDRIPVSDVLKINYGKQYTGNVAKAYISALEEEKQLLEELKSTEESTDKMVGFDEQRTPLYEGVDNKGNAYYYTLTSGIYKGPVFNINEEDKDEFLFSTEDEINKPTDNIKNDVDGNLNSQATDFKPSVATFNKTNWSKNSNNDLCDKVEQ